MNFFGKKCTEIDRNGPNRQKQTVTDRIKQNQTETNINGTKWT